MMEVPKNAEKRDKKEAGSREASVKEVSKDAPSEKKEKKEKKHKDKERKEKDKKEKELKEKKEKREKKDRSVRKEKTTDAESVTSQSGSVIIHPTPNVTVDNTRAKNRLSLPVKTTGAGSNSELSPVASFDFDHQLPSTRFPSNEPMPTVGSSEEDDSSSSRRPPAAAQLRRASYRRTTSDSQDQIANAGAAPLAFLSSIPASSGVVASSTPQHSASPVASLSTSSSAYASPSYVAPNSPPGEDMPNRAVRRGAVGQVARALPSKDKDSQLSADNRTPEKAGGIPKRASNDTSLGSGSRINPRLSSQFEHSDLSLKKDKEKKEKTKEKGGVKGLFDKLSRRKASDVPEVEHETGGAKVFGLALGSLETATHQELLLPVAIVRLTNWLNDNRGIDQDGIFRIAGRSHEIAAITALFDEGNYIIPDGVDPHSVSGTIKMFFKLLPDPLFTVAHYAQWVELIRVMDNDRRLLLTRDLITELPSLNRNLILYFLKFLHNVSLRRIQNRMTAAALGTVFGPFLIRATPQHQEQVDISTFHQSTSLLKWLIENAEEIAKPPEVVNALEKGHGHQHHRHHHAEGGSHNGSVGSSKGSRAVDLPRLAIETVKPTIERKSTGTHLPATTSVPALTFSTPSQAALVPKRRDTNSSLDTTLSPPLIKRKATGTEEEVFALTERTTPSPRFRRHMDTPDTPPHRWPLPPLTSVMVPKPTQHAPVTPRSVHKHSDLPPGFWKYLVLSIGCVIVITMVMRMISRLLAWIGW